MPPNGISIDVQGTNLGIRNLQRGIRNIRPVLGAIADYQTRSTVENFLRERDPVTGRRWKPWAPSTRRRRRSGQILTDTARMRNSNVFRVVGNSEVRGTNNVEYAPAHQFGAQIRRRPRIQTINFRVSSSGRSRFARASQANFQQRVRVGPYTITIPRRRFMGASRKDRRQYELLLSNHFSGGQ